MTNPSVRDIQAWACRRFGVTRNDLLSQHRRADLVRARHVAMWLARHCTRLSFPALGACFDDRDHTSIMHAVSRVDGLRERDRGLAAELDALCAALDDGWKAAA